MKTLLLLGIFTCVVTGCATNAGYEATLQTWVGDSTDHLFSVWGAPAQEWSTSDGGKTYQYERSNDMIYAGATTLKPVATTYTNGSVSAYGANGNTVDGSYSGTSTTYVREVAPPTVVPYRCVTRFTANSQGQIVSWSWEGNDCYAVAPKK